MDCAWRTSGLMARRELVAAQRRRHEPHPIAAASGRQLPIGDVRAAGLRLLHAVSFGSDAHLALSRVCGRWDTGAGGAGHWPRVVQSRRSALRLRLQRIAGSSGKPCRHRRRERRCHSSCRDPRGSLQLPHRETRVVGRWPRAGGARDEREREAGVGLIDHEIGKDRQRLPLPLAQVTDVTWLSDGTIAVAARERTGLPQRLWRLMLPSMALQPLTHDSSDYALAGVLPGGRALAAVRGESAQRLWIADVSSRDRPRQVAADSGSLATLEGIAWTPGGRIVYAAMDSGNVDVYAVDPPTANDGDSRPTRLPTSIPTSAPTERWWSLHRNAGAHQVCG